LARGDCAKKGEKDEQTCASSGSSSGNGRAFGVRNSAAAAATAASNADLHRRIASSGRPTLSATAATTSGRVSRRNDGADRHELPGSTTAATYAVTKAGRRTRLILLGNRRAAGQAKD
jgi:hypothetical protein